MNCLSLWHPDFHFGSFGSSYNATPSLQDQAIFDGTYLTMECNMMIKIVLLEHSIYEVLRVCFNMR